MYIYKQIELSCSRLLTAIHNVNVNNSALIFFAYFEKITVCKFILFLPQKPFSVCISFREKGYICASIFYFMTISYNWLHQYLPLTLDANELSRILTSVGLEVENMETYEEVKGGLSGLVIGEVMHCEPHPNANKLKLTKVNIGGEELLSIVCGAPNVAAGQKVVVATIGTTIYPLHGEAFEIKKAKIRGEESQGMLCAEDEIGLGEIHDGIIVLPQDATVGQHAKDYYQLSASDIIYEIGLTPNRMDAMSHLGVAKDVCAYISHTTNEKVVVKVPNLEEIAIQENVHINIEIEDQLACARYAGVCLQAIEVKESPSWLQMYLKAIGLRPINNIVDITNYVMHECGQPLHAFDLETVKGNKIVIKKPTSKTSFVALDGKEIILHADDLMIYNAEEPMCIAGVYGGLHSGVKNTTQSIFLESAFFEAESIRKTSLQHGLRTDSATRFEKGADISNVNYALHRAAQLIQEIAGGKVSSVFYDLFPTQTQRKKIQLSVERITNLAGKNYSVTQIKNILENLGFEIQDDRGSDFEVLVPFSKTDISMQADVVEEIMRIDGLDNIPFTGKISYSLPAVANAYKPNYKESISNQLVSKGFFEIFTNSITNANFYPDRDNLVKMMNSLSAHLDVMRASMLETGLEAVAYNLNRKNTQLKFYEFGKVYSQENNSFIENEKLAIYVSGNYRTQHYTEKDKQIDVYYVRGIIESLFKHIQLTYEAADFGLNVLLHQKKIGSIEVVSQEKLKTFDIKHAVLFAEIDWDIVKLALEKYKVVFAEIPKFPVVQRDLAIVVDKQLKYQDIQLAVKQAKCKLLQDVSLFDVFESEKLGEDKVSYALNFSFYDKQKTLTDIEVENEMKALINSLSQKVNATIRN